ncbi:PPK2 family polyphosphate:nucleotide phosphotransferase [Allocatelliglobosispora scoriae]|uniref:PPK2 family polyphosphate:nucleotide phosphotransferase n=1 Tax=Allocatelliglobosispora scoriae TaxID=643052 RepID=A0A841BUQ1_9ACTN|nr:PPK2 family polyphosphate kinase [Allocatelliglobosispora scoriae]MBB5870643.1 PPK2 family polyphosphate:nucleotide phosphotransferase [Allocatelliglobosispora scoriae]
MASPGLSKLLRVGPGPVDLAAIDPRSTPGLPKKVGRDPKEWSRAAIAEIGVELFRQQEMLFASAKEHPEYRKRVLMVLQAMDCGGKDGTIKNVIGQLNPQGVHIVGFGKPTAEELSHPFLWRIKRALPAAGVVGVFNRSHYEDVLVVRVHELVPARTWGDRFGQINRFERQLVDEGYELVKVMLHISPDEQRKRLLERLEDPTKFWKYNPSDVDERSRWPDYQAAYADVLERCGPDHAPWYVVPADRKWYRNWAVANLLLEALGRLKLTYPPADFDSAEERRRLEGERQVNSS